MTPAPLSTPLDDQPTSGSAPTSGRVRQILVGHVVVLVLIGALLFLSTSEYIPDTRTVTIGSVATIALFAWSVWSWWALTRRIFDPYVIFLISAYLHNAGLSLLHVIGVQPDLTDVRYGGSTRNLHFLQHTIVQTVLLILVCLAALHLGALLVAARNAHRASAATPPPYTPIARQDLRVTGWVLLAVSVIPTYLNVRSALSLRISQPYGSLYDQSLLSSGSISVLAVLAGLFVPGALFLLAGSRSRPLPLAVGATAVLLISGTWLVLGVRSTAIMSLAAFGWVWHTCVHRIPRTALISGAFVLLFVISPIINLTRQEAGFRVLNPVSLLESYSFINNPTISTIRELGTSMYTVSGTIDFVPSRRPHDRGVTYARAVLNVLPRFLQPVKPGAAYGSADVWFVNSVDPTYAQASGGLGFSFIAEAYLAFGFLGAPFVLLTVGCLLAFVFSFATISMHPAKIAAVASYLTFVLHYPRGVAEGYTRQLLLFALLPYLVARMLTAYRRSQKLPVTPAWEPLAATAPVAQPYGLYPSKEPPETQ